MSSTLLLFEPANIEPNDVQVLALEQEPEVIIVDETVDVEKLPVELFHLSDIPVWMFVLVVAIVIMTVGVFFQLYKRRLAQKVLYEEDPKFTIRLIH